MNPRPCIQPCRRASAILVVIVLLAIMTIMGAAYMQWCRASYEAAKKTNPNPKVGTVARAAVIQIGQALARDIVNGQGEFFRPDPATGPGVEAYDYPFTNQDSTNNRNRTEIYSLSEPSSTPLGYAYGGHLDDAWLASTVPDFSSSISEPVWPHITNLNKVFLAIPTQTTGPSTRLPLEFVVDFTSNWKTDTNVKIDGNNSLARTPASAYQPVGADADGDGVLDSRWTWASIPQINGIAYVMAVRVVDLSSLLNINAMTAMTTDGDNTFDADALPRAYYPTHVDASRLLSRMQSSSWSTTWGPIWTSELINSLTHRGITLGEAPVPPSMPLGLSAMDLYISANPSAYTANSSAWLWHQSLNLYGYGVDRFGLSDNYQFRYKNGLNSANQSSTVGDLMPNILRRDAASESTFESVDYSHIYGSSSETPSVDQKRLAFFQGADSNFSASTDVASRTYPAVRHMLTTISGSASLSPNFANMHAGAHVNRYDLKWQDFDHSTGLYDTATRVANIRDRLQAVLSLNHVTAGPTAYLDLHRVADAALLQQIACEYALAINDYSDPDHVPSSITHNGTTYYGLELLPFLREVYAQVGYDNNDTLNAGGAAGTDGQGDLYVFDANSCAVAIEIGNPFDRSIPAAALNGRIQIAIVQNNVDVSTWTFAGAADLPARDPAGTDLIREQLVIYSNPASPKHEPAGTARADLADATTGIDLVTGSPATLALTAGTLRFAPNQQMTVELRVDVGGGTFVAYDRLTVAGFSFPDGPASLTHHPTVNTLNQTPTNETVHAQGSMVRAGQNIRYLSNVGKASLDDPAVSGTQILRMPDTNGFRNGASSIDALGQDVKGPVVGDESLDTLQIPIANRAFMSVTELAPIFMFGFSSAPDGDFPHRFSGGDGIAPLDPERQFLDISTTANIPNSTKLPHAAMLLQEFTVLSPRFDGVDNDNDDLDANPGTSADNAEEQFVAGTININTAPLHILTLAAPMFESIADVQAMMAEVIKYRENTGNWRLTNNVPVGFRTAPGIISLGELLWMNPGGGATNRDMRRWGTDTVDQISTPVDLYPMPESEAAPIAAVRLSAKDGPEELVARLQSLTQIFNTRSDIYAAYVLVHGYPAGDFRTGAIESMRMLAIFDRSTITSAASPARILALYELDY